MKASIVSLHRYTLRAALSAALAIGAVSAASTRAYAFDLDPITISDPAVKTIDRDVGSGARIEKVTVNATIAPDPEALRYHSGVVLLKEKVVEAAQKACHEADPLHDDDECVLDAVKAAKPQVAAVVARAREPSA